MPQDNPFLARRSAAPNSSLENPFLARRQPSVVENPFLARRQPSVAEPFYQYDPLVQPEPELGGGKPNTGLISNTARKTGERVTDLGANLIQFIGNVSEKGGSALTEFTGVNPGIQWGDDGISFTMNVDPQVDIGASLADSASQIEPDLGYVPRFTWERFKDAPSASNLAGFIFEQGVSSSADMAAALITLPAYIMSRTEEIGEVRAQNQGRLQPSARDLAESAIPAVASSLLERIGARGVAQVGGREGIKEIGKAAGVAAIREGATEFAQEQMEYAGETVGTDVPFDWAISLDRGLAGAVAGAGFGGAIRAVTATVQSSEITTDEIIDNVTDPEKSLDESIAEAGEIVNTDPTPSTDPTAPEFGVEPVSQLGTFTEDGVEFTDPLAETVSPVVTPSEITPDFIDESSVVATQPSQEAAPTTDTVTYADGEITWTFSATDNGNGTFTVSDNNNTTGRHGGLMPSGRNANAIEAGSASEAVDSFYKEALEGTYIDRQRNKDRLAVVKKERPELLPELEANLKMQDRLINMLEGAAEPSSSAETTIPLTSDQSIPQVTVEQEAAQQAQDVADEKESAAYYKAEEKSIKSRGNTAELKDAIARVGGISMEDARAEGVMDKNQKQGVRWLFTTKGRTFDAMRERLSEEGFDFPTANDLVDALTESVNGQQDYYTPVGQELLALREYKQMEEDQKQQFDSGEWIPEAVKEDYSPDSTTPEMILADEAAKAIDRGMPEEEVMQVLDNEWFDDWKSIFTLREYQNETDIEGQAVSTRESEGVSQTAAPEAAAQGEVETKISSEPVNLLGELVEEFDLAGQSETEIAADADAINAETKAKTDREAAENKVKSDADQDKTVKANVDSMPFVMGQDGSEVTRSAETGIDDLFGQPRRLGGSDQSFGQPDAAPQEFSTASDYESRLSERRKLVDASESETEIDQIVDEERNDSDRYIIGTRKLEGSAERRKESIRYEATTEKKRKDDASRGLEFVEDSGASFRAAGLRAKSLTESTGTEHRAEKTAGDRYGIFKKIEPVSQALEPAEEPKPKNRIQALRREAEVFTEKENLTESEAGRFKEIMSELNKLRYQKDILFTAERWRILPDTETKSTLSKDVVLAAQEDILKNEQVYLSIKESADGVSFDADTAIDDIINNKNTEVTPTDFYDAFSPTREALRKQYGDTVTLYRAQGMQKDKATTNWATTKDFALQFGENVTSKEVPVDNVLAVNVTRDGKYHELIVGSPPSQTVPTKTAISSEDVTAVEILPSMFMAGDSVRVGNDLGVVLAVDGSYIKFRSNTTTNEKAFHRVLSKSATFISRPDTTSTSSASQSEDGEFGTEEGKLNADMGGLIAVLGAGMYAANVADVTVKELLQNSFDATKGAVKVGLIKAGEITITLDYEARTLSVSDNARGMTPSIVRDAFFTVAGSDKSDLDPSERSGGLGLAKMGFMLGSERLKLETTRDGMKVVVDATATEIAGSKFKVEKTPAKPSAHGTTVTVTVPENYVDPKTGEEKTIWMPHTQHGIAALNQPLIGNVVVKFVKKGYGDEDVTVLPIGNNFDEKSTPKLTSATFSWGTADIYFGVDRVEYPSHKILSSGVYQFDTNFKMGQSEKLPFDVIVNVKPNIVAQHPDYPFENSRERFKGRIDDDIKALHAYLANIARGNEAADLQESFKDIVSMPRLEAGEELADASNKLSKAFDTRSTEETSYVLPEMPKEVFIGEGFVRDALGVKLAASKPADNKKVSTFVADKEAPASADFMLEMANDPKLPIFHNNTNVDLLAIGKEYGEPEQFFAELGTLFLEMKEAMSTSNRYRYDQLAPENLFFAGISVDKKYGGIHVKVPYKAVLINPFYNWGAKTLFGVRGNLFLTMIHEIAHQGDMEHGVGHNGEMLGVIQYFDDTGLTDYFRDAILDILTRHESTFTEMRNVYGQSTTQNTAQSLEDYDESSPSRSLGGTEGRGDSEPRAVRTRGEQGGSGTNETDSGLGDGGIQRERAGTDKPAKSELAQNTEAMREVVAALKAQTEANKAPVEEEPEILDLTSFDESKAKFSTEPQEKSLYVAHNLSAENILHAKELGALAMPSLFITDVDKGVLNGFGEITLLADPSITNSSKAKTFDADVYSPRQPRATYKLKRVAWNNFTDELDAATPENPYFDGGRNRPDPNRAEDDGVSAIIYSDQAKYVFLKEKGISVQLLNSGSYNSGQRIRNKFRSKKLETEFEQWAEEKFKGLIEKPVLFKGFTYSGNRRYVDYTLDNVLQDMGKKLQGGEDFHYGVGSARSMYANQLGSISQIRKAKDKLVTSEEMEAIKSDSQDKYMEALDELKPFYKFKADSFGYYDDAGSAIMEGRRGIREAFNADERVDEVVKDITDYLSSLPTEYFETKIQRAVGIEEFSAAVVPRGTRKDAVDFLRSKGLTIRFYKKDDKADRMSAVKSFNKLLFSQGQSSPTTHTVGSATQKVTEVLESQQKGLGELVQDGAVVIHNAAQIPDRILSGEGLLSTDQKADALGTSFADRKQRGKGANWDTDNTYYHGTNAEDFEAFDPDKGYGGGAIGVWLDESPIGYDMFMSMEPYGEYPGGRIIPVHIRKTSEDKVWRIEISEEEVYEIRYAKDAVAVAKMEVERWENSYDEGREAWLNEIRQAEGNEQDDLARAMNKSLKDEEYMQDQAREQLVKAESDLKKLKATDPYEVMFKKIHEDMGVAQNEFLSETVAAEWRKKSSYNRIELVNTLADTGEPRNWTIVLDPKNIRSVNAAFDPSQSESSNILYSKSGKIRAYVDPSDNTVHIISDNIPLEFTDAQILGLIKHEVSVHAMKLGKSDKEFQSILKQADAMRKNGSAKMREAFSRVPEDTATENVSEETLAYFIETNPTHSLAQRLMAWFRKTLKAIGFDNKWLNTLTEGDLIQMATDALVNARSELLAQEAAGDVVMASQDPLVPIYSALTRGIEGINSKSMPAAMWKDGIKGLINKGLAKANEVEWTGINEFLDLQEGKVSKADVLAYLDANGVQVDVTVLGQSKRLLTSEETDRLEYLTELNAAQPLGAIEDIEAGSFDELLTLENIRDKSTLSELQQESKRYENLARRERDKGFQTSDKVKKRKSSKKADALWERSNHYTARAEVFDLSEEGYGGLRDDTKFGTYQLSGGTNYREVLLTLPKKKPLDKSHTMEEALLQMENLQNAIEVRSGGQFVKNLTEPFQLADNAEKIESGEYTLHPYLYPVEGENFTSDHFPDVENPLAHIRLNDRVDADGNRVLFIEELQSDWAQKGRQEGFIEKYKASDVKPVEEQENPDTYPFLSFWYFKVPDNVLQISKRTYPTQEEALNYILTEKISSGTTPSAPFVGKTDAWVALSIKRIIKIAVDEGYDSVAFINGEQSADRYDLSKQLDRIVFDHDENGLFEIDAYDKNRNQVIFGKRATRHSLPDIVGKDLAQKMIDSKAGGHTYSGLDLKVGGDGMIAFYDKIVPSVAKGVLKKLGGGPLERTEIATAREDGTWMAVTEGEYWNKGRKELGFRQPKNLDAPIVVFVLDGEWRNTGPDSFANASEAAKWAAKNNREAQKIDEFSSFTITPAMASKVKSGGLPLFSKAPAEIDNSEVNFAAPEENLTTAAIRKIQDKFKVLKDLQANIQKAGGTISETGNPYRAEEAFHGKAEDDIRLMRENHVEPLANKMADYGIEMDALDKFVTAKHANERNAHIATINPDMPDGGSGMTNAEAAIVIAKVEAAGNTKQYEDLAARVYAILQEQRDLIRNGNLEDKEGLVDTWEAKYNFYVPLKGFAADTESAGIGGTGKGFNIGGKESKRALGRSSESASPTAFAITDLTRVIIRKRKNEVGNALLEMVENNPNKTYWEVFTDENPDTSRQLVNGVVKNVSVPMSIMQDKYFTTKKGGKTYYIALHDPRMMKAMKNLGPETNGALIRTLSNINRVLSALNTSYSPEFIISNFSKDIQTAILNLSAEQSLDEGKAAGKKFIAQTVKDVPVAMRSIYASLRGKKLTGDAAKWQADFAQFRADGAKTGYFDMKDLDGQVREMNSFVAMAKGGLKGKSTSFMKSAAEVVENINSSVENAVRLSAYVNAVKAGIPRSEAASLAKNMTVNFNRRGEIGTVLNSLYMFANASIQGVANFARTMGTLKGDKKLNWKNLNNAQRLAVGIVAGTYFLALANRESAGDDDDDVSWYDKVPNHVKERNLVFMKSLFGGPQDGTYWKIPMPYGYNVFGVIGAGLESIFNGGNSAIRESGNVILATLGSFSPIGFQDSETATGMLLKNAAPTVVKPVVEIALNENFFGSSIYNENFPFGDQKPNSALGRRSTPAAYQSVATWLNKRTGGSQYRSGVIDVNPDIMNYVMDYFGGASYGFFGTKLPDYAGRKLTGVETEDYKTPFLSRLSGRVLPYEDMTLFYDRRDEIGQIKAEMKAPGASRAEFRRENRGMIKLIPQVRRTERRLSVLRKRRDVIYEKDITTAARDSQLKLVEQQMKSSVDKFNKAYNQARQ